MEMAERHGATLENELFRQNMHHIAVDAELWKLDEWNAELIAKHLLELPARKKPEIDENVPEVSGWLAALDRKRGLELLLIDELQLEQFRAELSGRRAVLPSQCVFQLRARCDNFDDGQLSAPDNAQRRRPSRPSLLTRHDSPP
jgi:hypothetical protein